MSRVDNINSFKKSICPKAKLYSQKLERFPFWGIMVGRSGNNPPEVSDGFRVLGAGNGTVFDDSHINRQMRNSDLTTFMLKTTRFYSPFMLKKFEWTTFRIAKKIGEN